MSAPRGQARGFARDQPEPEGEAKFSRAGPWRIAAQSEGRKRGVPALTRRATILVARRVSGGTVRR